MSILLIILPKLCNFINRNRKNSFKKHDYNISNCDSNGNAKCTQCQKGFNE